MEDESKRPRVGVGVMILKDGKVLLGKRKNAAGEGEYAFPGGNLEYEESIVACAERETKEETGLSISGARFLRLVNLKGYARHYVCVIMAAEWASGEPTVMEADKCDGWEWHPLDALPTPLFATVADSVEAMKTGRNFYDA